MKTTLKTAAFAVMASLALSSIALADDMTASTPDKPAAGGTPASTDSKNQENTPAGPAAQGATGTTGTPQQTKTGDGATTGKAESQKTPAPNAATKKVKKKKKKPAADSSSTTNVAPTTTP